MFGDGPPPALQVPTIAYVKTRYPTAEYLSTVVASGNRFSAQGPTIPTGELLPIVAIKIPLTFIQMKLIEMSTTTFLLFI